jgi:hypothetical protein
VDLTKTAEMKRDIIYWNEKGQRRNIGKT